MILLASSASTPMFEPLHQIALEHPLLGTDDLIDERHMVVFRLTDQIVAKVFVCVDT